MTAEIIMTGYALEDGRFGPTSDQLNPSKKNLQPLPLQLIWDLRIPSSSLALDLKLKLSDPADLFYGSTFRISKHYYNEGMAKVSVITEG